MQVDALLKLMIDKGASDLHLRVPSVPVLRIDGVLVPQQDMPPVTPEDTQMAFEHVTTAEQRSTFLKKLELDFAYSVPQLARFRVSVLRQRGTLSIAFRLVPFAVLSIDSLGLPAILKELVLKPRGLILVTGPTGSGKSTTLAAIVDHINANYRRHVITIEDPIEFVHADKLSLIEQREVGWDTVSFEEALKHVVRQSPDVILIGEMRDEVTIQTALNAAEIGHLVLSTLHTASAMQTLERIVSYFPPYQHELIRTQLSNTMQGILSQQLLVRADGPGRVPAVEVMMRSPTICELILRGETGKLNAAMREDSYFGNETCHEALIRLYREGTITLETALAASPKPQELKNEIQGLRMDSSGRGVGTGQV